MTDSTHTLTLSTGEKLEGQGPVVVIGPNGSGKTRFAVELAKQSGVELIGALRNLQLPENVSMRSLKQANQELQRYYKRRKNRWWEISSEIENLFSKLIAEDLLSASQFRDACRTDPKAIEPEITKILKLRDIWSELFPGREVVFDGHNPTVTADHLGDEQSYSAQTMSDGERVALYLIGRVLDAEGNSLVVDEPEVHFHSRLASRFWNRMEDERPDLRFVYVTHDLPFALSRCSQTFVLLRQNEEPEVLADGEQLPPEVASGLLAAASFSVHASRVLFCEGVEGRSVDQELYTAWFRDGETVVIPVGDCRTVIASVTTFSDSSLVTGLEPLGIVDRDYWPDEFLNSLPESVSVLPVHEVESLFCLSAVFVAVAKHLGREVSAAEESYDAFLEDVRGSLNDGLIAKQVLERFKRAAEHQMNSVMNGLGVQPDLVQLSAEVATAFNPASWPMPLTDVFDGERSWAESAKNGNAEELLRVAPGKVALPKAAKALGLSQEQFVNLVCAALLATEEEPLAGLGAEIEAALQPHLPSREPYTGAS